MKALRFVLCAALLAVFIAACQPVNPLIPDSNTSSMKGYELYSWEENGQWYFSVLVGTNREKTLDEIQSSEAILRGIEELLPVLESLPAGQFVIWKAGESLAFPPEEIIQQVERVCTALGLELDLVR
ncbi:MAG: hypothetical protein ABIJ39_04720 [Chloroflexota bacterium]